MQLMTCEIPLTPRSKKILTEAQELAKKMGDNFIGPKHLTLALLTSDLGETSLLVKSLGVDLDAVSAKVRSLL